MGVKLRMYNDAWRQECELFLRGRWSSSSDFDQRELARTQGANHLDGLLASPVVRSLWCGHLLVRWAVREEERREWSRRRLEEWDGLVPVWYWYKEQFHLYTPDPPTPEEQ